MKKLSCFTCSSVSAEGLLRGLLIRAIFTKLWKPADLHRQENKDSQWTAQQILIQFKGTHTVELTTLICPLVLEVGSCSWTSTSELWNIVLHITELLVYMQWLCAVTPCMSSVWAGLTSLGGGQTWEAGAQPAQWRWCRRPRYHTDGCTRPSFPLQLPLEPSWTNKEEEEMWEEGVHCSRFWWFNFLLVFNHTGHSSGHN